MTALVLSFLAGLGMGVVLGHFVRRQRACVIDAISPAAICPLMPPTRRVKLKLVRTAPAEKSE